MAARSHKFRRRNIKAQTYFIFIEVELRKILGKRPYRSSLIFVH
jgi:hypothetical protein